MRLNKYTVYIASPYSQGDPELNAHFQCKIFNQLLNDGKVLPVAPLWSHFQHILFPRPYKDWINYDQDMLRLYDFCLRLNVSITDLNYYMDKSSGADAEVDSFKNMGKPVFYSIDDMYNYIEGLNDNK
jgi:hypothetical protein